MRDSSTFRRRYLWDNAPIRFEMRDFVRDAVLVFNTPLFAALSIALYTRGSIASASFLLPDSISLLMSLSASFNSFFRRALKTPRLAATRIAFFAELVIAMESHDTYNRLKSKKYHAEVSSYHAEVSSKTRINKISKKCLRSHLKYKIPEERPRDSKCENARGDTSPFG